MVEHIFAALTEQQLKRGSHRSMYALERAIREYLQLHYDNAKPYKWSKTADEIIESVNSVISRINQTAH